MKKIKVVIGANFGDEGKGLMVDYLASSMNNGIVVRFNGGAQATHTVTVSDGRRHVFGHIAAGSFVGLPMYLSSFFALHPMEFRDEVILLNEKGVCPQIFADNNCLITTPYDVMINQIAEITRGNSKHGSCGMGFNETITRSLQPEYSLSVKDLKNMDLAIKKLLAIRDSYAPCRLKQLGINSIPSSYEKWLKSDGIVRSFLSDIDYLLNAVTMVDINILSSFDTILFEGAQGLLLDQNHEYFPNVTHSNTGIKNVRELIKQAGYDDVNVEIVYVTRAYMTRHGAGRNCRRNLIPG